MIKTFDIARMVIKQASKEFADKYKQDDGLTSVIQHICDAIDTFAESGGIGIDVDVDSETKEIIIGYNFDMCEFHSGDPMYEIMELANDIIIKMSDDIDNAVRLEMRFRGVWMPK